MVLNLVLNLIMIFLLVFYIYMPMQVWRRKVRGLECKESFFQQKKKKKCKESSFEVK